MLEELSTTHSHHSGPTFTTVHQDLVAIADFVWIYIDHLENLSRYLISKKNLGSRRVAEERKGQFRKSKAMWIELVNRHLTRLQSIGIDTPLLLRVLSDEEHPSRQLRDAGFIVRLQACHRTLLDDISKARMVEAHGLSLDENTESASYNGQRLEIKSGAQFGVLKRLHQDLESVVSYSELDEGRPCTSASPALRVAVSQIRTALKKVSVPFSITTATGQGYKLFREPINTD